VFDREKLAIPPHRMSAGRYLFTSQNLGDCFVVKSRFERAEIKFANVNGFLRVVATTLSTSEMRKKRAFIHGHPGKVLLSPPRAARIHEITISRSSPELPRTWNWHLVVSHLAKPVAVASSGQSLRHS